MIVRTSIIALLIACSLFGCTATKPLVWLDKDVSFSDFKFFEIAPVYDGTKKTIDQSLLSFLTDQLKEQFEAQNLPLNNNPQTRKGVLIVQSGVIVWETSMVTASRPIYQESMSIRGPSGTTIAGTSRKAQCTIRTRLIDKESYKVVGEITTTNQAASSIIGSDKYEWFLKESAEAVTQRVGKVVHQ